MYEYYRSDNLRLFIETSEYGDKFLHLSLVNWSPSVLKELRNLLAFLRVEFFYRGHEYVFAATYDQKVVKFWNTIMPCDILDDLPGTQGAILGGWSTVEV